MDDMTQKGMLLDVSISPKIKIRKKIHQPSYFHSIALVDMQNHIMVH